MNRPRTLARENPFRVERVLRVRYQPAGWTWEQLLGQLKAMNWRGALVGHKGAGKTTLIEDLAPRLEAIGLQTYSIRLDEDHPTITRDRLAEVTAAIGRDTIILLDGCEQLTWLGWQRFLRATRRARGIVVTTHLPGRLPTLVKCEASAAILRQIIINLTDEQFARSIDVDELLQAHHGNIREVLRHLYDQCADGSLAGSMRANERCH